MVSSIDSEKNKPNISITLDEASIELIDRAAAISRRSRSGLMELASVKMAKAIIAEEQANNMITEQTIRPDES